MVAVYGIRGTNQFWVTWDSPTASGVTGVRLVDEVPQGTKVAAMWIACGVQDGLEQKRSYFIQRFGCEHDSVFNKF